MNKSNKKKPNFYRDLLYKALLFIGTVAVIVYSLPRDGKFNYQFDINKPWKYGQLIATFDFPIYKTDEVVRHEQDSILARFQPYFQENKDVETEGLKKLRNDYQSNPSVHGEPTVTQVVSSLLSDSRVPDAYHDVDDFADDMGYRKPSAAIRACDQTKGKTACAADETSAKRAPYVRPACDTTPTRHGKNWG